MGDMSYDADESAMSRDAKAELTALLRGGNVVVKKAKDPKDRIPEMKLRYQQAQKALVGDTIACPTCKKQFVKATYNQIFCSRQKATKGSKNKCKDRYWNLTDDTRRARAIKYE